MFVLCIEVKGVQRVHLMQNTLLSMNMLAHYRNVRSTKQFVDYYYYIIDYDFITISAFNYQIDNFNLILLLDITLLLRLYLDCLV